MGHTSDAKAMEICNPRVDDGFGHAQGVPPQGNPCQCRMGDQGFASGQTAFGGYNLGAAGATTEEWKQLLYNNQPMSQFPNLPEIVDVPLKITLNSF